jgi:hypothetical protein
LYTSDVICSSSPTTADSTAIFLLSHLQHDNDKNFDDKKKNYLNDVFITLNKSFKANNFTLNFNKTNLIKFCTHNRPCAELTQGVRIKVWSRNKYFLGLQTGNTWNWKTQVGVYYLQSSMCFTLMTVISLTKPENLQFIFLVSTPPWNNFLGKCNRQKLSILFQEEKMKI